MKVMLSMQHTWRHAVLGVHSTSGSYDIRMIRMFVTPVIIQRLKSGTHPVLRPSVSADKCDMKWLEIIEACWNEVPAQRPVVNGVSKAVQKLARLK